jgi:hypothetical protein
VWRQGAKLVDLLLQPALQLVRWDGRTGMASDCELNHAAIVPAPGARGYGCQPASDRAQMGHGDIGWAFGHIGATAASRKVAPVALLALTQAVWVLVIAVLSIFAALALLAGEVDAAFADGDEPPRRTTSGTTAVREPVARLPRRARPRSADHPLDQGTTSPRRIA